MSYDHSAFAAMMGFCKCAACHEGREPFESSNDLGDIEDWHLWTIRSMDLRQLVRHRDEMRDMGFDCGVVEPKASWDAWPLGTHKFSARILRRCLSEDHFEKLAEWDRRWEPK